MKLNGLFCYGGPLIVDQDSNYYGVALNSTMFLRYYQIIDNLSVLIGTKRIESGQLSEHYTKIDLQNFKVIPTSKLSSLKDILFRRSAVKKTMADEIKKNDVLIARLPSNIGCLATMIAKKMNKPYLVEVVGCPWDAYWNHSLKGKLVAPFMWWATRRAVKNAPYALYVTNEFLQKRYPCVGKTIGCSDVSLPMLDNAILEKRIAKIENMINNQPIVIGTSATVNIRYKGQQYIIKAIAKLNKQGYNFEYHLVGGGDNTYLKSIAEKYGVIDKVKFLGLLPHEKVFEYLDSIDIYAQPSKTEGLPRALIEAMSRGCPAIGSDVGGIPELLEEDGIFKSADIDSICEILKSLDKQAMLSMANYNFEKAKEYNKELLEQRRNIFFKEFAKEAGNKSD